MAAESGNDPPSRGPHLSSPRRLPRARARPRRADLRRRRPRSRRLLGALGRRARVVAPVGHACSTGSRRTRSGSSAAQLNAQRQLPRSPRPRAAPQQGGARSGKASRATAARSPTSISTARCRQFANVLKSLGVEKGDRVAIYLPLIPELAIAMLACARIGAVHSVVFGGFSAESLRDRINDAQARLLDHRRRRIPARPDRAAEADRRRGARRARRRSSTSSSSQRGRRDADAGRTMTGGPRPLVSPPDAGRARSTATRSRWTRRTCSTSSTRPARPASRRASCTRPAAISSAPTRRRSSSSICKDDDVYWCTADIGWVTGHSYVVYGPLANGATVLMYEGAPDWPEKDRFWAIVERYGVTILYTAPTAIRAFMRWGTEWPAKHDLSSLRLLGSVGEPINPEAWMWYHQHHRRRALPGRRHVVADGDRRHHDHAAARRHDHSSPDRRRARSRASARRSATNSGDKVEVGGGLLALTRPWPSMLRGIYGDPERYVRQYWSKWGAGVYFTGDGAQARRRRLLLAARPRGRRAQRRRPPASARWKSRARWSIIPAVAEAAVVGRAHELKGQAIAAFVTLKEGTHGDRGARRRAEGARRQEDRRDRAARRHPVRRRSAEDALGQDHAPPAARHRRRQGARRHDDAGRSRAWWRS